MAPRIKANACGQELRFFAPVLATVLLVVESAFSFPFAQVPVQVPSATPDIVSMKIRFDLSVFNEDGLYGPHGGLRAAAYEFCIPANDEMAAEVESIDPTIQIYAGSPGRVGCGDGEYLCIGSTYQPGFRDVLTNLAQLEYVTDIEPSVAE